MTLTVRELLAAADRAANYPPGYGGFWGVVPTDRFRTLYANQIVKGPSLIEYG